MPIFRTDAHLKSDPVWGTILPLNPHDILYHPIEYLNVDADRVEKRKSEALTLLREWKYNSKEQIEYHITNDQDLPITITIYKQRLYNLMKCCVKETVPDLSKSFTVLYHEHLKQKHAKEILSQEYIRQYAFFRCINYLITGFPVYNPETDTDAPKIREKKVVWEITETLKKDRETLSQHTEQSMDYKTYTRDFISYKIYLIQQCKIYFREGPEKTSIESEKDLTDYDIPPLIPVSLC